jgi:hypothetical protein
MARLFNPLAWAEGYTVSRMAEQADVRALRSDWRTTGHDLRRAMPRAPHRPQRAR